VSDMQLERVVADLVERIERRYYGKYRGFVVDNDDPAHLGRLRVRVPSVLGRDVVTGWAMPCVPYGGAADQGLLLVPDREAGVWVEFEEGDLEFPIWVGTFWSKPGDSELPKPNGADGTEAGGVQSPPTRKILKTAKGHTLQFEDADGSEMIVLYDGANHHVVTLDASGVKVVDGKNQGNQVVLDSSGLTVQDKNGNQVILASAGMTLKSSAVKVGSDSASEPMVLGQQFSLNVTNFITALSTHTHIGNLGAPTSPPVPPPMNLSVPLSQKHKVE
jgi:hypothetical protein